jgi:hypothetical protein
MRLGMFIGASGAPFDLWGQINEVVQAEKDGFASFWFAQIAGLDALTVIAMAGPETSTIEIGTAVVPTYTRHPNVMAQQALTANAATKGRLLGRPLHRPVIERLGLSSRLRRPPRALIRLRPPKNSAGPRARCALRRAAGAGRPAFPVLISARADDAPTAGARRRTVPGWRVKAIASHRAPASTPPPASGAAAAVVAAVPVAVCDDGAAGRAKAGQTFRMYGNLTNYRASRRRGLEPGRSP